MRTIPEAVEDIKSILNNIERTESCDGETLVDINELADEILTISAYNGKKQTNADRIRSMSDEELADYIFGVSVHEKPCVLCSDDCDFCELTDEECKNKTFKWLQSEVEVDNFE